MPQGRQGSEGALDTARALVAAALAALEGSRERIDNLNVYPVPDGDTGTNMALTVRAVAETLTGSTAATRDEVASDVTRAALMAARGNSGVILSQLVRGAAEAIAAAERLDPAALALALRAASDAGYAAVREPQEGTILTVARALAERAEAIDLAVPVAEMLSDVVAAGEAALARTPEQLPMLAEAGVVDAG
ncbi:MAG: DAK2 domain-containing protein, partial [Thermoleophilia bacterium]|nr:DAK2 domain-containing protein [Thermoleophilia bacterium]